MENIGFSSEAAFSMGQLMPLFVIFVIALVGLYLLRNKSEKLANWFPNVVKTEQICQVKIQKVDKSTTIYQLQSGDKRYLIMKSAEQIIVLD